MDRDGPPGAPRALACALDADGMARRASEFRALLSPTLLHLERSAAGASLHLALDGAQERALDELLRLERECCPFWRFSMRRTDGGGVRLDVAAEPPDPGVIEAFLTIARG